MSDSAFDWKTPLSESSKIYYDIGITDAIDRIFQILDTPEVTKKTAKILMQWLNSDYRNRERFFKNRKAFIQWDVSKENGEEKISNIRVEYDEN